MDPKRPIPDSKLEQFLEEESKGMSTQTIMFHQMVAAYLGLNITDHKILDFVLGAGKVTAGRLAEMTGLTTGAITSALNRLEKSGYVRRVKDPGDLRIVWVEPQSDNLYKLKEVFAPLAQAMNGLYSKYKPEELRLLLDFLEQSNRIMAEQTQRLKEQVRKGKAAPNHEEA
ncbi:MarR family winged helix-turn-helix transcriptional regulator [Paenibacillus senegalensis]|uniref:MarR family winged helix-turn-helix transcriptional regulator n=1 Tax=Paenibacillus senegalensis TaxID=1465766 RepID=UPI0002894F07|nr:helix-turn-helix domain-containing protein [Paenibacillus senegalensis]